MIKKIIPMFLAGAFLAVMAAVLQIDVVGVSYAAWDDAVVNISDYSFSPSTVYIQAGDTVRWINNGYAVHTVTSNVSYFNSGSLFHGHSFSFRFTAPGTYYYHCGLHPSMKGKVVVKKIDYYQSWYEQPVYVQPVYAPPEYYAPVNYNYQTDCYPNYYQIYDSYPCQKTFCCGSNYMNAVFNEYYQYSKKKNWQPYQNYYYNWPYQWADPYMYYPVNAPAYPDWYYY